MPNWLAEGAAIIPRSCFTASHALGLSTCDLFAGGSIEVVSLALRSWRHVMNFGTALVMVASLARVTFVVYPTACVRPAINSVPAYVAGLYQIDGPNNCFPCLHSMLAVLGAYGSACNASRTKRSLWRLILWIWLIAVLLSIIALRQHTGLDLLSGIVLGIAAIYLFRRLNHEPTAAAIEAPAAAPRS